jgi:flagellar basal-body rod protein FlgG
MERGLYIAAAGMLTELARQDLIANDLANAATPGYKQDRAQQQSFGSLLVADRSSGRVVGSQGAGPRIAAVRTDMTPGPIQHTDEPLDFAVQGPGFFAVQTAQGVRYTRNGRFSASPAGELITQTGDAVLDQRGRPVKIGGDGTVAAAALGVYNVTGARKIGDSLFTGAAAGRAAGVVEAGALEGSGTDATRTLVEMMTSLRAFESGQKVITTIDETLGRAVNDVGSVGR